MLNKSNFKNYIGSDDIIIVLYDIFIIISVFSISMFRMPSFVLSIKNLLVILMFLVSLLLIKNKIRNYTLLLLGLIISLIVFVMHPNDTVYYLFMVLIFFTMSNISPRKILSHYVYSAAFALIIIFLSSKVGLIPNLVFLRNGIPRQSFGTIYPLNFASYIFYICTAGAVCWSNKRNAQWVSLILLLIAIWLNKMTGARNDAFCIIGVALIILLKKVKLSILFNKVANLIGFVVLGLCVSSVFITKFISYDSKVFYFFNVLFSGRLTMQSDLLSYYSPKLFGQSIFQVGMGGYEGLASNRLFYFYIDNSFARMIYISGILYTLYVLYIFAQRLYTYNKEGYIIFSLIFCVLFINGMVEDSLINIGSNVFLTMMLTPITVLRNENGFISEGI